MIIGIILGILDWINWPACLLAWNTCWDALLVENTLNAKWIKFPPLDLINHKIDSNYFFFFCICES